MLTVIPGTYYVSIEYKYDWFHKGYSWFLKGKMRKGFSGRSNSLSFFFKGGFMKMWSVLEELRVLVEFSFNGKYWGDVLEMQLATRSERALYTRSRIYDWCLYFQKSELYGKKKNDVVQKRCSQRVELGLLSGFYCCPNYRRWGQYGACSPGGGSKNQDLKAETIPRAKYPLQVYPFPFLKNRIVFDKILMFFIKFCFRFLPANQPGTHYSLIL